MDNIGDIDISNELRMEKIMKKQEELAAKAIKKPRPEKKHPAEPKIKKKENRHKDFKKPAWFRKYAPVIFITLSIILAVAVRMHYAGLPLMDDWAHMSAVATFRPGITDDVNKMYPYYSDAQKNKLIDQQVQAKLNEYIAQIAQKADSLRDSYKDPSGQTYLYGIDPYNYYKKAKDGTLDDFLTFFEYYLHRFVSFFNQDISLATTTFYIPLIFVTLTIFPVYFITRRIAGDIAGLIASAVFAIHPEFLKYSLAGMTDTNTLNIFFMLAISWMFLEIFLLKRTRNRIIAAAALILLVFLFRFTWTGYYIIFGLLAAAAFVYLSVWLFNRYTGKLSTNRRIIYILGIGFAIMMIALLGLRMIIRFLPSKVQLYLGSTTQQGIWPDSFSTISELKSLAFTDMITRLGGPIFAIIVLFSAIYTFWKIADKRKIPYSALLAMTATALILPAGLKAIRIFPFSIPFICILFGFGIILIMETIPKFIRWIDQKDRIIRSLVHILVAGLLLFIIGSQFMANYADVRAIKPKMDDSLYDTAAKIGQVSPENSKIFAWWDKGHFFWALSDRDVLIKASPRMPRTYWMAKALMTPDENQSAGIIRMLDCSGEQKALSMIEGNLSTNEKISIIDSIVSMNKTDAEKYLSKNGQDKRIAKYTHCNGREIYIALTDDMFTRFHTVQQYAYWDFDKTDDEQQTYKAFKNYECSNVNESFTCIVGNNVIKLNSRTGEKNADLAGLWFYIDDNLTRFSFDGSKTGLYMIVYPRDGKYYAIAVDRNIAESMYIRLMILGGYGLEDFEQIADNSRPETIRAVAYRVKWR